jgi:hypothetical protein
LEPGADPGFQGVKNGMNRLPAELQRLKNFCRCCILKGIIEGQKLFPVVKYPGRRKCYRIKRLRKAGFLNPQGRVQIIDQPIFFKEYLFYVGS